MTKLSKYIELTIDNESFIKTFARYVAYYVMASEMN